MLLFEIDLMLNLPLLPQPFLVKDLNFQMQGKTHNVVCQKYMSQCARKI